MSYKITYDFDFAALRDAIGHIEERLNQNSNLAGAVQSSGDLAVEEWIRTAGSKFKHSNGDYARGVLEGVMYPFDGDPLHYKIVHPLGNAKMLEDGYEPFDMKKMLFTSDKVRISKDGKRYLIIPFNHGTPGTKSKRAMPKEVYEQAKDLRHSVITGVKNEGSVKHARTVKDADLLKKYNPNRVKRNTYKWGEHLGDDVDDNYKGMVRFQKNPNIVRHAISLGKFSGTKKNMTDSMQNYSSYMTFRVMSEDSADWQHPGMKAMNILGETVEKIRQPILSALEEAAKEDLKAILNGL